MTVQATTPAGTTPFGLPVAAKAKGKGDGNPAEPGFASLLAAMVVPGQVPVPIPTLTLPEGEAVPGGIEQPGIFPLMGETTPAAMALTQPPTAPGFPPGLERAFAQVAGHPLAGDQPLPPGLVRLAEQIPAQAPAEEPAAPQPVLPQPLPVPEGDELVQVTFTPVVAEDGGEQAPMPVAKELPPPTSGEARPIATEPRGEGHGQSDRRNNPDQTRGLERAVQVSQALQHKSPDAANPFPLPPAPPVGETGPITQPVEPAPPSMPDGLSTTERYEAGRLMDALGRSLRGAQDGRYSVTLKLYPEQLGEVRLQIHLTGREVQAVMEVASPEARQSLESRGHQLRQSLQEAGLTLTGFDVSTGQNRQTAQERRQAFEEQLRNLGAPPSRIGNGNPPVTAIERIKRAGRPTGRLDTMA